MNSYEIKIEIIVTTTFEGVYIEDDIIVQDTIIIQEEIEDEEIGDDIIYCNAIISEITSIGELIISFNSIMDTEFNHSLINNETVDMYIIPA